VLDPVLPGAALVELEPRLVVEPLERVARMLGTLVVGSASASS
jgi:hypothetical protein